MADVVVFYGTLVYGTFPSDKEVRLHDLPDGVFLYYQKDYLKKYWYAKDLTPVLLEDVPLALRTLVLIMGIGHP